MNTARELIITCDGCNTPIDDEKGWLWIDRQAVDDHQREMRAWTAQHEVEPGGAVSFTFGDARSIPERIRWNAHHKQCDPNPDANSYTIESERMRTWADLTHWTGHLMEKPWMRSTDWLALLSAVADGTATRLRPVRPSKLNA